MTQRIQYKYFQIMGIPVLLFCFSVLCPHWTASAIIGDLGEEYVVFGPVYYAFFHPVSDELVTISPAGVFYWDYENKTLLRSIIIPVNVKYQSGSTSSGDELFSDQLFFDTKNETLLIFHNVSYKSFNLPGQRDQYPLGTTEIWGMKEQKKLAEFNCGESSVANISMDGQWLATGHRDFSVKVWSLPAGQEKYTLKAHTGTVSMIVFSPDGRLLMTGSSDNTISLWDMSTGRETKVLIGHLGKITCAAFSPDGSRLYSGSEDNTLRVWDVATGKEIKKISDLYYMQSITLSHNGSQILINDYYQNAGSLFSTSDYSLIDQSPSQLTATYDSYIYWSNFKQASFSNDSLKIVATDINNPIQKNCWIWDIQKNIQFYLSDYFPQHAKVRKVKLSPDGNYFLTALSADVRLWDSHTNKFLRIFLPTDNDSNYSRSAISSLHWFPDEKRILTETSNDSGRLPYIWNVDDGSLAYSEPNLFLYYARRQDVITTAISPDGSQFFVGDTLRNAETGETLLKLNLNSTVYSVDFSPDGQYIATGGDYDTRVNIWNASTGRLIRSLEEFRVRFIKYLPSGDQLLTISFSDYTQTPGKMKLWDVNTGELLMTFPDDYNYSLPISFSISPEGDRIAMSDGDQFAVWDINTGLKIDTYKLPSDIVISSFDVFWDESRFLVADENGVVSSWIFEKSLATNDWSYY